MLWYLFSYDGTLLWETRTCKTDRNENFCADFDNRYSSEENVTCICWYIIIIIIILVIAFMQSIYNYIPETNHFSRVQSVAAVLYL